jgi:hypothetical protein
MKLTGYDIEQISKIAETEPSVKLMLDHYLFITQSLVYESLVTRIQYINRWNEELNEKKVQLINTKEDLATHDKAVDRVAGYFKNQLEYLQDTEEIRAMLTPEEKTRAGKDKRIKSGSGDIVLG